MNIDMFMVAYYFEKYQLKNFYIRKICILWKIKICIYIWPPVHETQVLLNSVLFSLHNSNTKTLKKKFIIWGAW